MRCQRKNFLATDFLVAINSTKVDVTDFSSIQIDLSSAEFASLTFFIQGTSASCSKDIIFKFAAYDSTRAQWDTIDFVGAGSGVPVTANGTTIVQKTIALNPDIEKIKLLSVQNQEVTSGYTVTVNVSIFMKQIL